TRFRAGQKIHGWGINRRNLVIGLDVEGRYTSVRCIERQRFAAVVYWTDRRIKNRHLSPDFFQHKERSMPPDLPIIESIKRANPRHISSKLASQLRHDRGLVVLQITRIKAESCEMPWPSRARFLNLRPKRAMNALKPFPWIPNVRVTPQVVNHL